MCVSGKGVYCNIIEQKTDLYRTLISILSLTENYKEIYDKYFNYANKNNV